MTQRIQVSTLPNGLRVISDTMPDVESVSLGIWAGVGTRHEMAEVGGISHLLEHMAFKGTKSRSARQIAEDIEAVGGHLNAYTAREVTAYHARVLKEDVPLVVDILSDMLQNSVFAAEELEKERQVILQEIGQSLDTPDDLIFDTFQETAFPGQQLGAPILGTAEVLQRITQDQLATHLSCHYGADTMVLAAAGRVDHDALVALATDALGELRLAPNPSPLVPARYEGGQSLTTRPLEQTHVLLGYQGVGYLDHPAYYTQSLLTTILGGGMSSRLFQTVREDHGLAYSIFATSSAYADGGTFAIYAGTAPDATQDLVNLVTDQLHTLAETLADAEIARARAQMIASLKMGLESTMARCDSMAQHLLMYGRPIPVDEIVATLNTVTKDDLCTMARNLMQSPPTIALVGPNTGMPEIKQAA